MDEASIDIELQKIDYSKKWFVMAAVSMGIFLSTIDSSIVNIALPTLVRDLEEPLAIVEWVILAYLLTVTTLMVSMGRLADMIGKKPLYAAGFVIFTIGSGLCGISTSIGMLVGFRVFQAIGAAMMMALGTAIVTESFPAEERGKALGFTGLMVSLGVIAGPTIGGMILEHLTWNWLFFVNIPVGMIGIPMVLRFVPAIRPRGQQRFDYWGALLLFSGLCCLLLGLSLGQERGFGNPLVLALIGVFLAMIALFIRVERTVAEPMVDLTLFHNSWFSISLITGFMTFVASSGSIFIWPFFLQDIMRLSPSAAGFVLVFNPIALGISAPIAGALSDRIGSRKLTTIGLFILILGYWIMSGATPQSSMFEFALRTLPVGIGMGVFQSPNNSAVMGSAPRERLGVVSGMLTISRTLGQTVGISIMSTVWVLFSNQSMKQGITDPIAANAAGYQRTILCLAAWIFIGFLLGVWALVQEQKLQKTQMKVDVA